MANPPFEGATPENAVRAITRLMETLDAVLTENQVPDHEKIVLSLGYIADMLGAMLASIPAKDEAARARVTEMTCERLRQLAKEGGETLEGDEDESIH